MNTSQYMSNRFVFTVHSARAENLGTKEAWGQAIGSQYEFQNDGISINCIISKDFSKERCQNRNFVL